MDKSDDKILAAIAHIGIIFDILGLIIALIIYIIKGKESYFVSFSAKQALGWQLIAILIKKVVAILTFGSFVGGMGMGIHPLRGAFGLFSINGIIGLLFTIVAVIGAVKVLNGEKYKYPLIGDFVAGI